MGNTVNVVDFSQSLTAFLASAVSNGTYADLITVLKFDEVGNEAQATDIDAAAGQLWANVVDDFIRSAWDELYLSTKTWRVADNTARDALGSDDGLAVDDIGYTEDTNTFWYVVSVDGPSSSTWAAVTPSADSWSQTLAVSVNSGANTPIIDNGQAFQFEDGTPALRATMDYNTDDFRVRTYDTNGTTLRGTFILDATASPAMRWDGTVMVSAVDGEANALANRGVFGSFGASGNGISVPASGGDVYGLAFPRTGANLVGAVGYSHTVEAAFIRSNNVNHTFFSQSAIYPATTGSVALGTSALHFGDAHLDLATMYGPLTFDATADVLIDVYSGNPETNVTANPGSFIASENGNLYAKESGAAATGWARVLTETLATGNIWLGTGGVATATSRSGIDDTAIHDNVAGEIAAVGAITVAGGDYVLVEDVGSGNVKGRVTAQAIADLAAGLTITGVDNRLVRMDGTSSIQDGDVELTDTNQIRAVSGSDLSLEGDNGVSINGCIVTVRRGANGGDFDVQAGNAASGNNAGGTAIVDAGSGSGTQAGGIARLRAGAGGATGAGAVASVVGGAGGATSGAAGQAQLTGGAAGGSGNGADAVVSGGAGSGAGTGGQVQLTPGANGTGDVAQIHFNGPVSYSEVRVAAAMGTNENNYNPGGSWPDVSRLHLTPNAANTSMTGLDSTDVPDGFTIMVLNTTTSDDVIFQNENASSSAANRFLTPGGTNINLRGNGIKFIMYDGGQSRWRVME